MELLEDAKRRVLNLPPVLASEKVKVEMGAEKGQQKLDKLFARVKTKTELKPEPESVMDGGGKRKREIEDEG